MARVSRLAGAVSLLCCVVGIAQPSKISPELSAKASAVAGGERLPVFVLLAYQPQAAILAVTKMDLARDRLMSLETRQARLRVALEREIRPMQERLLASLVAGGATHPGAYTAINMITAEVPVAMLPVIAADPAVSQVFLAQTRQSLDLSLSVPAMGAPAFWNVGRTGNGASVALIDTGVRTNHPAFVGRNIVNQTFLTYGSLSPCFDDDASTAEDSQGHGTHLAGILMSQGSPGFLNYLGVDKGLGTLYNLKTAYKVKAPCSSSIGEVDDRDLIRALEWAALNTPSRIVSLSFGAAAISDGDDVFTKTVDFISDIYDTFIAVAAGNAGPNRVTVQTPAIGHNVTSVANWDFRAGRVISNTSSRGPTIEGRFKPDIAGPGVDITSTNFAWDASPATADDYVSKSGTSMAAPHVAGAAALLFSAGVTDPLQMKAILLNTTGDSNWLADRGWGFVNLANAQPQLGFRDSVLLQPGGYQFYRVSPAPGPLAATINWNRHIDGGAAFIPRFNNLDLFAYDRVSGTQLGASVSVPQNVEKLVLSEGAGDVVVKVDTAAPNPSIEFYGIAMSKAFTRVSGPVLTAVCNPPAAAFATIPFSVPCTVTNRGDLPAFGVTAAGVNLGAIAAGASAAGNLSFTGANTGTGSFTASVNSMSYGEAFATSVSFTVPLSAPPPAPAAATNPVPANAAAGVSLNGSLSWTSAAGATAYEVYFGATNPPPFFMASAASMVAPPLSGNVTYFWRVVARNAGGSTTSPVWSFTTAASSGLRFVPVAPCRLVDTRETQILEAGSTRSFALAAHPCVAPAVPAAYSLNISVVPEASLAYLTVWPAGQPQPLAATLNSLDGRIKANAAIVPAGADGAINVFATDRTHVIVDINGYFAGSDGLAYYPVTPCRAATAPLAPMESRSFAIPPACRVPASARAYAMNATVFPKDGAPFGYLSLWPSGQAQPTVSTLNALTGAATADMAIVPAGTNGEITALGSDDADLVLDVHGYFAPAGSVGALTFRPVEPCRLLDTRVSGGPLAADAPREVPQECGGSAASSVLVLNATVVPDGPLDYLTLWPTSQAKPPLWTLTAGDGAITSNAAFVGSPVSAVGTASGAHVILDLFGVFLP